MKNESCYFYNIGYFEVTFLRHCRIKMKLETATQENFRHSIKDTFCEKYFVIFFHL